MIPGPVTGHVPIDPGGAQRQLTDTAGEAGADAGTSFADLLAAMLAPGGAGAQLQAPASNPAEAVLGRLDAAEVFNETGLFRGAAPLSSVEAAEAAQAAAAATQPAALASVPAPNPQAELQVALSPPAGGAAPAPGVTATAADQIAADGGTPASGSPAGIASKAAHIASSSLRGPAVALPGSPPQSAAAGRVAPAGGRVAPRTAAMVAQLLAARAASSATQVSVQAVEGGISVMARVDRLSREERDRLRGQIGELLARHGFGGAEIWLNGEAWPLPQGKDD
jgi:hypothetical protein